MLQFKKESIITMHTVLSIAGSDASGGAGIQADLKTVLAHHVYGMTAITALTAQNTCGVQAIAPVTPAFLTAQIDSVFTDIFPDAVKIGMIPSGELCDVIAERLRFYKARQIVLDPVMVATSGASLSGNGALQSLKSNLLPLATIVTPNIPETEVLAEMTLNSSQDMELAARAISGRFGCAVLVKGGHRLNDANDYLYADGRGVWFQGKRINNPNTHGTGCTLSSAIASNLAKGLDLEHSVRYAKNYISGALNAMLDLGKGSGPMDHGFMIKGDYSKV